MKLDHLGNWRRSHNCGELRPEHKDQTVHLAGWVHRARDHGGVLFVNLRDRYGITQVVFNPGEDGTDPLAETARELKSEFVIGVTGKVLARPDEMVNDRMPTGGVEVEATAIRILNDSRTPPFVLDDETITPGEDLRLEYRFLDLRRAELSEVMGLRHRVSLAVRTYLNDQSFWEIETPVLVKPTPEGARDYIVPSRVHPGSFYALPQSPQLYKQMLMVSGMDRYYQLARCLRDEDLRADRQPEHTQIDLEMSFVGEEDVYQVVEGMMKSVFDQELGTNLEAPFPRMTYHEAMARFGSDKPDLRFDFEIVDLTEAAKGSGFKIFDDTIGRGDSILGLRIPQGASLSRKEQEELEKLVQRYGAKGLARSKVVDGGLDTGIAKFVAPEAQARLIEATDAKPGDLLAVVADRWIVAARSMGALRSKIGNDWLAENPKAADTWRFLWVHEFPVFEEDPDTGELAPAHHMFTMPMDEDIALLESDPAKVRGKLYDLVLNGTELGSGSIRIHRRDIQEAVMRVAGVTDEEAELKFGFLLKAFQYGAPPHGGIALGLDRIIMLMAGRSSLRDTIAFPKTTSASSLMDGAPTRIEDGELQELHIRSVPPKEA